MSPVVFPPGYTRSCIDGKVKSEELLNKIKDAFITLAANSDFTLLEGSGHMGVGSIANLNNAQVAGALGLEVVIVAPGGLGVSAPHQYLILLFWREISVLVFLEPRSLKGFMARGFDCSSGVAWGRCASRRLLFVFEEEIMPLYRTPSAGDRGDWSRASG